MNEPVRVGFAYNDFLNRLWNPSEFDPRNDGPKVGAEYAKALHEELRPLVTTGEIRTHGRRPLEAGGPGVEFDFVDLLIKAGVAAGMYVGFKEVARDIRALLTALAKLGDGRVAVNGEAATWLAVEAIASDEFQDVALLSTDVLQGATEALDGDRGFLVHLAVNGARQTVAIAAGGRVLGSTGGVRGHARRPSALDTPPEPPFPGSEKGGIWDEVPSGGWQWIEYRTFEDDDEDG